MPERVLENETGSRPFGLSDGGLLIIPPGDSSPLVSADLARPFEKGRSGNSAGRPRGARDKATLAAEALFDSKAEALSRKAVELALGGNEGAPRICLDRIIASRRERPILLAVPAIRSASDIAAAMGTIVKAAVQGAITPDEAFKLSRMVDTIVRAIETSDFDKRLQILENAQCRTIRKRGRLVWPLSET